MQGCGAVAGEGAEVVNQADSVSQRLAQFPALRAVQQVAQRSTNCPANYQPGNHAGTLPPGRVIHTVTNGSRLRHRRRL